MSSGWIVVYVNFTNIFTSVCRADDYYSWTPFDEVQCIYLFCFCFKNMKRLTCFSNTLCCVLVLVIVTRTCTLYPYQHVNVLCMYTYNVCMYNTCTCMLLVTYCVSYYTCTCMCLYMVQGFFKKKFSEEVKPNLQEIREVKLKYIKFMLYIHVHLVHVPLSACLSQRT